MTDQSALTEAASERPVIPTQKTGIGSLSLKTPAATTASDTDPKGGEGGSDQPSLPLSNAQFLDFVMRDVPAGAHPAVCSKAGDPANGGWIAEAAGAVDRQCPSNQNNYFNSSSFLLDESGEMQARKDRFAAFHVLVLDDVGTKVDRAKLAGVTPTYEIETSPGNSQVGFRLATPLTSLADVKRLQDAVMAANLCDQGAGGSARWVRLPDAINGKSKYRSANGEAAECRLVAFHPEVAYTVDQLVTSLDLQPAVQALRGPTPVKPRATHPAGRPADGVWTPAPDENPVITALRERGLYKREIAPGRHDVTCPLVAEHTDAIDNGTAYFEPDDDHPIGGFVCQHSHGGEFNIGWLLRQLDVEGNQARGKARIDIVPGELNRIRRAAEYALSLKGEYFQMGGAIVVVRRDPGTGDITTELLGEARLTAALSEAADWFKHDGRSGKTVRTDPPMRTVQNLLKAQQYDLLPVLTGLARQPYFRETDGVLVTTPGYDATSGRYAAFNAAQFNLPEPTRAAAEAALDELNRLLDEFRFASDEDRAAAMCAMLTAAVRPSLPTAPAFNITASAPGSGKSYLASTVAPFAGPGAAAKVSYPRTDEEATKSMLSIFLGAPAAIVFDDMQTPWMSYGAINRALTSDTMTDRVLGVSRTVTVGTRSLILGTGNNIGPVRDMTRRVVTIKLHHKTATPALTSYAGNPVAAIQANRTHFVSAALTIIAAYRQAGSPKADVPSIASFGQWDAMCRQPLLWLGQPDPASSMIEQIEHDPDQDVLGHLLITWFEAFGDKPVMLRSLVDEALDNPDLEDALKDLPVFDRDAINRSKLGWYLKHNSGRVVGGYELQKAAMSQRNGWRVVKLDDASPATVPPSPPLRLP